MNNEPLRKKLSDLNHQEIYEVSSTEFKTYGRVLEGYQNRELIQYIKEKTKIPETGNCYLASVPEMEQTIDAKLIQDSIYGGMPIQIGYCNGKNSTYNGFEYHKGSETIIAVTDFMLVLGHIYDMKDNTYHVEEAQVFLVRQGQMIEIYQTTLHLSPCKVTKEGFQAVIILPKGTNTPLDVNASKMIDDIGSEHKLLLQKNKWVIAHPQREALIAQGAYPGVIGDNIELRYE